MSKFYPKNKLFSIEKQSKKQDCFSMNKILIYLQQHLQTLLLTLFDFLTFFFAIFFAI
jgi:hypothetical protein